MNRKASVVKCNGLINELQATVFDFVYLGSHGRFISLLMDEGREKNDNRRAGTMSIITLICVYPSE